MGSNFAQGKELSESFILFVVDSNAGTLMSEKSILGRVFTLAL